MSNQKIEEVETRSKPSGDTTYSYDKKIISSTTSGPKSIEEISSETKIPAKECQDKITDLVDLGILVIEHDSDRYGHELLKVRRAGRNPNSYAKE